YSSHGRLIITWTSYWRPVTGLMMILRTSSEKNLGQSLNSCAPLKT
ncbi:uncharacterized protein METZ01_LOCUS408694, partial [marine metagenome]